MLRLVEMFIFNFLSPLDKIMNSIFLARFREHKLKARYLQNETLKFEKQYVKMIAK